MHTILLICRKNVNFVLEVTNGIWALNNRCMEDEMKLIEKGFKYNLSEKCTSDAFEL